jgi:hypothetical protein
MDPTNEPYDPLLAERILAFIRVGGYPQAAAEAAGVRRQAYREWLRDDGFAGQVRQAAAQARLQAELAVYDKDPKFWLTHGPGRETADNPGWTGEVRADPQRQPGTPAAGPEWASVAAAVLEALAAFPQARLAVAQALQSAYMTVRESAAYQPEALARSLTDASG